MFGGLRVPKWDLRPQTVLGSVDGLVDRDCPRMILTIGFFLAWGVLGCLGLGLKLSIEFGLGRL